MKRCCLCGLLIILVCAQDWATSKATVAQTASDKAGATDDFGGASNGIRLAFALDSRSHELIFTVKNVADNDEMVWLHFTVLFTSRDGKFNEDEFSPRDWFRGRSGGFWPSCAMLRGRTTYSIHRPLPKTYSVRQSLGDFGSLIASGTLEDLLASGDSITAHLQLKDTRCKPCEHASCWMGDARSKKVTIPAGWQRRAPHQK